MKVQVPSYKMRVCSSKVLCLSFCEPLIWIWCVLLVVICGKYWENHERVEQSLMRRAVIRSVANRFSLQCSSHVFTFCWKLRYRDAWLKWCNQHFLIRQLKKSAKQFILSILKLIYSNDKMFVGCPCFPTMSLFTNCYFFFEIVYKHCALGHCTKAYVINFSTAYLLDIWTNFYDLHILFNTFSNGCKNKHRLHNISNCRRAVNSS